MKDSSPIMIPNAFAAAVLAVGLVVAGWALGAQIKATRLNDRYVTVKGLVERKVKSDLAVWPITYKVAGDDLGGVYNRLEADRKSILQFLAEQGIQPTEVELGVAQVTDTQANEWSGNNRAPFRYIVEQRITVHTARVDQVAAASQKSMLLVQKGIVLGNAQGEALAYKFTGLNAIKPDMITEATHNARAAAERFASDSGSKVGSIRTASQGVFSISQEDEAGSAGEEGSVGLGTESSVMKTVRVVTSVEYYLQR